jgi:hypothetical protein
MSCARAALQLEQDFSTNNIPVEGRPVCSSAAILRGEAGQQRESTPRWRRIDLCKGLAPKIK